MSDAQKWLALAGLVLTGWLITLLAPVLTPFLAGALIAYLCTPLADKFETWKLSRTLAVAVVFVVFLLVLLLLLLWLVPKIERQLTALLTRAPQDLAWLHARVLPWLESRFGLDTGSLDFASLTEAARAHWREAGGIAAQVIATMSRSGLALLGWLANLVLIPVVAFYLLRDWHVLVARANELVPRRVAPLVAKLARESDDMLGAFLRGQLMVMTGLATIYTVGLWLTGLEQALLIGLMAGLVSFVPYLGLIVGVIVAGLSVLLQTHEVWMLLPVLAVFGVGQLVEGMLLTPWLVGDRIGLHPVAVIFAVLAGGQLFGFVGVLLALPVAAVLAVVLRHAHQRYVESDLYRAES